MSDYTAGSWVVHGNGIFDSKNRVIGTTELGRESRHADARRIVACVNACEGMDLGDLENGIPFKQRFSLIRADLETAEAKARELEAINLNYATHEQRLMAKIDRREARIAELRARVKELEAKLERPCIIATELDELYPWYKKEVDQKDAEIARLTARAKTDEARVKILEAINLNYATHERQLQAQLAELQARVRPGVEELCRIVRDEPWRDDDWQDQARQIAQAIHAMLPPVPKVPTVEEMMKLGVETLDSWKGNVIDLRLTCEAIHKAMGGGE